jgi:hypothetical protein
MEDLFITNKTELVNSIKELLKDNFKDFSNYIEGLQSAEDKLYRPKQAMEYLDMARSTFYRYVRLGIIEKYMLGDSIYYKKSQLDSAIKKVN